jgi:hypothetical protein
MLNKTINKDIIDICSKQDIILKKNKLNNNFIIDFIIENNNINIYNLINFSLYKLIGELNQDILETIKIVNLTEDDSECDILFLFKSLSKELGISKKYMLIKNKKQIVDNQIIFKSYDLDVNEMGINLNGYEKIKCNNAMLTINLLSLTSAQINYTFNMEINDYLPIYMENITGLMMKKIFYKLKSFIEMIR